MNKLVYNNLTKSETVEEFTFSDNDIKQFEFIKLKEELNKLKKWFDVDYSRLEQKYRRLISLEKADDDGIAAEIKLRDLYLEAEEKRKRIQELELLIK